MKYGFIGAGNMATALISGAVNSGVIPPASVMACDVDEKKLAALSEKYGIDVTSNTLRLVKECDALVLAVKPNVLPDVLGSISGALSIKNPLVISIAAGQSLERLSMLIGAQYPVPVIRVMPNLNAAVGAAISAYCGNENVTAEMKDAAVRLLRCSGETVEIKESLFPVIDAVGGASPAFCFMFADALARAAVKNGMARDTAYKVVIQAIEGSMKMLRESGEHPWELTDRVCSPGGITIEGVLALQEFGFDNAVTKAVDAVIEKDLTL